MTSQEFTAEKSIKIGARPTAIIQAPPPNIGTTVPHRSEDQHHPIPIDDRRRQAPALHIIAIDSTAAAPDAEHDQITAAFFLICLFLARIHNVAAAATAASVAATSTAESVPLPPPSTRISSPSTTGHATFPFADVQRHDDDDEPMIDNDGRLEPPLGSGRKKEDDDDDNPMGLVVDTTRHQKRWVFTFFSSSVQLTKTRSLLPYFCRHLESTEPADAAANKQQRFESVQSAAETSLLLAALETANELSYLVGAARPTPWRWPLPMRRHKYWTIGSNDCG
jgi:hypothetical protein